MAVAHLKDVQIFRATFYVRQSVNKKGNNRDENIVVIE